MDSAKFLLVVAFVCGAAGMGIEMSAFRLLEPHFGSSLFVTTNIVGIVLLSLSAGYYLGGRVADKTENGKLLFRLILASRNFPGPHTIRLQGNRQARLHRPQQFLPRHLLRLARRNPPPFRAARCTSRRGYAPAHQAVFGDFRGFSSLGCGGGDFECG